MSGDVTGPADPAMPDRRGIRLQSYDYAQSGAYFVTICAQDRACLFGDVVEGDMRLNGAGLMVMNEWFALPERFPHVILDAFVVMPNHIHGIIVITSVGATLVVARNLANDSPDHQTESTTHGRAINAHGIGNTQRATTRVAPTDGGTDIDNADGNTHRVPTRVNPTDGGTDIDNADGNTLSETTTHGAPVPITTTLGDIVGAFKSRVTVEYIRGVKTYGWRPFHRRLWQRNYYEHIIRGEKSLERIRKYVAENPARWAHDRENPLALQPDLEEPWAQ